MHVPPRRHLRIQSEFHHQILDVDYRRIRARRRALEEEGVAAAAIPFRKLYMFRVNRVRAKVVGTVARFDVSARVPVDPQEARQSVTVSDSIRIS